MFKENWRKIWALAEMRDCPVDDAFDEFRQAVRFDKPIDGVDFDFHAAHEQWQKMTIDEQREAINEYVNFVRRSYWSLVKEYNK